jgi:hypothetical protein
VLEMLKNLEIEKNDQPNPLWKGLEKFKDLDN